MYPDIESRRWPAQRRCPLAGVILVAVALAAPWARMQPAPAAVPQGEIVGTVSNQATKALLAGAVVEIEALGLATMTDAAGQFRFRQVPIGEQTLAVSYAGLDRAWQPVLVPAGAKAVAEIALRSSIYMLDAVVAVGEREGNAAAITQQRNAESVRTTAAFDAYGNLFNNELGELAVRLPGVAGIVGDEGVVATVSIRGMGTGLNSVTIDGNKMVSTAPRSRQYTMNQLPSGFFENMEVITALTPDIDADSLGGNINLSTRTGLKLVEKRSQELEVTAKWAPPFYAHNPSTHDRPLHGFGAYTYRERFDALGGHRNLALSFNVSYRENATGFFNTNVNYLGVTPPPVPLVATNFYEGYNNRKTLGTMLRADYKVTPNLAIFATVMHNLDNQPSYQFLRFGSSNSSSLAAINAAGQPTGSGAILPGYHERFTQVTPQPTSRAVLASEGNRFRDLERQRSLGFVQTIGALKLDANAMHGESNVSQRDRESGGIFTSTITGIGFRQERTRDGMAWTQTAGPSVFDLANYTTHLLSQKNNQRLNGIDAGTFNAEYTLDAKTRSFLKAGTRLRVETSAVTTGARNFTYVGPDGVAGRNPATGVNDDDLRPFQYANLRLRALPPLPYVDVTRVAADLIEHPARWSEDLFFRRQQFLTGDSGVTEQVNAGYVEGGTTWRKKLRVVGGVRFERTRLHGFANVPVGTLATAAQIPDPVARADYDYNHPSRNDGQYQNWFPSTLVTYWFTRNLLSRVNWTNSIGRPTFGILVPMEAVNSQAATVTIDNPAVRPQTARSLDVSLEYYFEPVGMFAITAFRKEIKHFIVRTTAGSVPAGPDNGFSGNYAGYTIIQDQNAGTATVRGLEFNYQHNLTFLPGIWRGFSLVGNFTRLIPTGDFGNIGPRTTNLIPNFVPTTANAGISFRWRQLLTRVLWNYTGKYLTTYSTNAALLAYTDERRIVNVSASYAWRPTTRFYCDIGNVFDEPSRRYLYEPGRFNLRSYSGTWINAGCKTQF